MPNALRGQPKYLACTRALALVSGLAGAASGCVGAGANASTGDGPSSTEVQPDGGGADRFLQVVDSNGYDRQVMWGVVAGSPGCDVGGVPELPSLPFVVGVAGATLLVRRRRRSESP